MNIIKTYLNETKYKTLRNLLTDIIKYIIIHHTAGTNSLNIGRGLTSSQVSFQYLINKLGVIYYLVDENYIAWQTGESNKGPIENTRWGRNLNPISIGIELENLGNGKDPYTKEQIDSLIELVLYLIEKHNIKIENVLGHKELTTNKIDPSSNFFEGDMDGFRNFLKKTMEKEKNEYLKFDSYKLFNDLDDGNGETKKLIEIGIKNFIDKLENKTLKKYVESKIEIRKGIK